MHERATADPERSCIERRLRPVLLERCRLLRVVEQSARFDSCGAGCAGNLDRTRRRRTPRLDEPSAPVRSPFADEMSQDQDGVRNRRRRRFVPGPGFLRRCTARISHRAACFASDAYQTSSATFDVHCIRHRRRWPFRSGLHDGVSRGDFATRPLVVPPRAPPYQDVYAASAARHHDCHFRRTDIDDVVGFDPF